MADVQFSLEPVLMQKEILLEQLQLEMRALEDRVQRARAVCQTLEGEWASCRTELWALMQRGQVNVGKLARYRRYLEDLAGQLKAQQAAIQTLSAQIVELRSRLLKLQQEREMLIALKERQRDRLLRQWQRVEARQLDEAALLRFHQSGGTAW